MIWESSQFSPCALAKAGSGGPEMEISFPPGLRTARDLFSVSPSRLFRTTS